MNTQPWLDQKPHATREQSEGIIKLLKYLDQTCTSCLPDRESSILKCSSASSSTTEATKSARASLVERTPDLPGKRLGGGVVVNTDFSPRTEQDEESAYSKRRIGGARSIEQGYGRANMEPKHCFQTGKRRCDNIYSFMTVRCFLASRKAAVQGQPTTLRCLSSSGCRQMDSPRQTKPIFHIFIIQQNAAVRFHSVSYLRLHRLRRAGKRTRARLILRTKNITTTSTKVKGMR